MTQKLYAYVDESGQDTKGELFIVAVVVTGVERDALRQALLDIERVSRKRDKKWTKARPVERETYIRRILGMESLHGSLYYSLHRDSQNYVDLTIQSTARALLSSASEPYQATVLVDGLARSERQRFTSGLRRLNVSVNKVRGVKDETDVLIRLADAMAGFSRAGIRGDDETFRGLFQQALNQGIIREA